MIAALATATPQPHEPRESPLMRTLRALQCIAPDYTNVPEASRPLLVELKHELRDVILATVNSPEGRAASPDELTSKALARLASEGVAVEEEAEEVDGTQLDALLERPYRISDVRIEQPSGHPELLAVRTTLGLTCSDDTSLYLLERAAGRWRLVIAIEKNDYEDVSGAACAFEYAVSPPDERGSWYVVAVDLHCWCTSNWQGLRYAVLRVGASPYEPRVLLSGDEGIFLGVDPPPFTLATESASFSLRVEAMQSLDTGILVREHVLRYDVQGDSVRRVPPLATRPEDFLDEWINLTWDEAARWVDGGALERARRWHARFETRAIEPSEILFIQPCPARPGETQIGLETSKGKLYFTIRERDGSFFVQHVGTARLQGCPGERSPYPTIDTEPPATAPSKAPDRSPLQSRVRRSIATSSSATKSAPTVFCVGPKRSRFLNCSQTAARTRRFHSYNARQSYHPESASSSSSSSSKST